MEINTPEIYDPSHLSEEELDCVKRMAEAKQAGVEDAVEDDPIARGLVNGYILNAIGQSAEEPGYDWKIDEEVVANVERALTPEQTEQLLSTLKARFEANKKRHKGIEWLQVKTRLNDAAPEKLWSLNEMERTGGEPDVIGIVEGTGEVEFWDCSSESPEGRRVVCYDAQGQEVAERAGYNPKGNAVDMAEAMGLGGLLNEEQYRRLQKLGKIDVDTWSWIDTPEETRAAGVALDGNRAADVVYVLGHNPYFHLDDRAFRGWLRV